MIGVAVLYIAVTGTNQGLSNLDEVTKTNQRVTDNMDYGFFMAQSRFKADLCFCQHLRVPLTKLLKAT